METSPPRPVTLRSFLPALGWLPKVQVSNIRANGLEFLSLERFLLSLGPLWALHPFLTALHGSREAPFRTWMDSCCGSWTV